MAEHVNLKEIRTLNDTVKLVIKNDWSLKMTNAFFQILNNQNKIKEAI